MDYGYSPPRRIACKRCNFHSFGWERERLTGIGRGLRMKEREKERVLRFEEIDIEKFGDDF